MNATCLLTRVNRVVEQGQLYPKRGACAEQQIMLVTFETVYFKDR